MIVSSDGAATTAHLVERAAALYECGRFHESRELLLRAVTAGDLDPTLPLKLGWSCIASGSGDAVGWMGRAVANAPQAPDALLGYGASLQGAGRIDEAIACFERLLVQAPVHCEGLVQLGICRLATKDYAGAEALFRRAIGVRPDLVAAWTNLCVVLDATDRTAELLDAVDTIARLDPACESDSFVDRAFAWGNHGRLDDAIALCERWLPSRPSARGHFIYSTLLLRAGRLDDGWMHYEFRWNLHRQDACPADFGRPAWTGQSLRSKTILLLAEQGFGDTIQCLRYAPTLKASGATVWARVRPGIAALTRLFAGVDRVFERDDPLPEFDFSTGMMSLPRIFGPAMATRTVRYLDLGHESHEPFASQLATDARLRVGLAWAGDPAYPRDQYRSIALRTLAPLFAVDGARFVSLQRGHGAAEIGAAPELPVEDLCPGMRNFGDAGLIDQLDVIIAIDSTVAHLAGALGKRVWLLLSTPADSRWLDAREDTPWYPTFRLFRQTRPGHWDDVVARVATALRELASSPRPLPGAPATRETVSVPDGTPQPPPDDRPPYSSVAQARVGLLQYLPQEAWIGDSLRWYGEYLQPQIDLLLRLVAPRATAIDVGAGVGTHAIPLARHLGVDGHLIASESRPLQRRILSENLAVNRIRNVTLLRRALGQPTIDAARQAPETIDELDLERLALIRTSDAVDAASVLAGAERTLWRLRPILLLSVASAEEASEVAQRARDASYACWQMTTPYFDPRNFNRRDHDVFGGACALAVLAIPEEHDVRIAHEQCRSLA